MLTKIYGIVGVFFAGVFATGVAARIHDNQAGDAVLATLAAIVYLTAGVWLLLTEKRE